MKKKVGKKVIPIPGLKERLMEKGLYCLQEKNYSEAAALLEQARELDPDNGDIYIGLVMAYYESGNVIEAKRLAYEMLNGGIGDYIETLDLYIMILVQMNEYIEVVRVLDALFEEQEVPVNKREHFSRLLDFSRKRIEIVEDEKTDKSEEQDWKEKGLGLEGEVDSAVLLQIVARLSTVNVRPYVLEIKSFLTNPSTSAFIKTVLLNILREQEYAEEVVIEKFGMSCSRIPEKLPDPRSTSTLTEVVGLLAEKTESKNPVLFSAIRSLAESCFFLFYPFIPDALPPAAWAAGCHYLGETYHGDDRGLEHYASLYCVDLKEAAAAMAHIQSAEEISSLK
ncbi:tetratricopeptide repeat protein [Bacillus massilinigeriensis]|uniref:tetratricopeptide repeat protein n=1 Tax=Bacillus mediterraneensis TaxID=1805474 RepID=UPI0008F7E6E5|nr:tetratricopeptide repeat protein [Bacillus mediterraneensis]